MSETDPVVVVGGGPAGFSAATAYRALGGARSVVLLCAEGVPPYRRPPLTKEFLRGAAAEDDLALQAPGEYARQGIDLRLATGVVALDPRGRTVTTDAGERVAYSECVLCTGAEPVRPPLPGIDLRGVQVIRTVRDSARLAASAVPGMRVAVIGSGFIGCEAAVSLAMRGAGVHVVSAEEAPQAGRLGPEIGGRLASWMREAGVELLAGRSLEAIEEDPGALRLVLDDGELRCDRVLVAVGVRPRVRLAEDAGLAVEDGAIVADEALRTSAEGVSCAGDVALAMNASAGRRLRVEHWGEALRQGTIAGARLAGDDGAAWDDVPGFWSTIGHRTLKQAAWGDGWDRVDVDADARGFTAWYGRRGLLAGVLTHNRDEDYEGGRERVRAGEAWPP